MAGFLVLGGGVEDTPIIDKQWKLLWRSFWLALDLFFLLNRKMLQSLGRPEVHMALDVVLVRGSGQEHEGCLLLTSEVLFVVSISEDTQQQAFPITEISCAQDTKQNNLLTVQLKQPRVASDVEVQFQKQDDWG